MFLFLDGVRYNLWAPQKEDELEKIVVEHYKEIFGENAVYFKSKKKKKKGSGLHI